MKYRESLTHGSVESYGTVFPSSQIASYDKQVVSVSTNPRGDNVFNAEHKSVSGSIFNNEEPSGSVYFVNFASNFYNLSVPDLVLPDSPASRMTRLLANSNPATPDISLPNFLFELKDVPDMIRQGGRLAHAIRNGKPWKRLIRPGKAAQDMASANLAIQFGWMPFVSDLQKLITFQSSLDKTKKKFEQLQSGKGLRVRQSLGQDQDEYSISWPLWSGDWGPYYADCKVSRVTKSWGVARWKPTGAFPLPSSDSDLRKRALGLSLDQVPIAIWEALPWSFLVDYFFNVGNLLQAANRVVATPVSACVMTAYTTNVTHKGAAYHGRKHVLTGGTAKFWRNTRHPMAYVGSNPLDHLSFFRVMNPKQLSILASLHVTRSARNRS